MSRDTVKNYQACKEAKNITHNQEKKQLETDPEMTQMLESAHKDFF